MVTSWVKPCRAHICLCDEATHAYAWSAALIWASLRGWGGRGGVNGNCGRKTTSDGINRRTTKPVGGSRLSERFMSEIYGGSQGCRADIYQACCKFRSALSQIYDLCFPSATPLPLSLPPLGATGVGDEVYGMISHRMKVPSWIFEPPRLWRRRQQCSPCSLAWLSL